MGVRQEEIERGVSCDLSCARSSHYDMYSAARISELYFVGTTYLFTLIDRANTFDMYLCNLGDIYWNNCVDLFFFLKGYR